MKIFVTGAAGYIGSHVCKAIAEAGHTPIAYDNLTTGNRWAIKWGPFIQGDILEQKALDQALRQYKPEAVIHLASLINARDSMAEAASYYENNLVGTFCLLKSMKSAGISHLVFSSSASVYGMPQRLPIQEDTQKKPLHPYGSSKSMAEQVIKDFHTSYGLNAISLRYFNAAGADRGLQIGEARSRETHLIPRAIAVAYGALPSLKIYGNDLGTKDGTAVRDYIHVTDLASAHLKAVEHLITQPKLHLSLNLGTGKGVSILEIVRAVEKRSGKQIALKMELASTDAPSLVADASLAKKTLQWEPKFSDLETIIDTACSWHLKHSDCNLFD